MDKIIQITNAHGCVYGISQNGNLYIIEDNEWIYQCSSPVVPEKLKEIRKILE